MTPPAPDEVSTRRLDRWSGGCLIAAGLLVLPVVTHPDILWETTFADAAQDTALWVPMHALLIGTAVLSIVGLAGVYVPRAGRLGRLGAVGFGLAVPGLVLAACAFYAEAFLLPVIAREEPELVAWDGPVLASWGVRTAFLAGLWLVGLALLGVALWRSRSLPAGPALTLTGSTVAFAAFAGPFVPVLGVLATLAFVAAHVWVGADLWRGATGHVPVAETSHRWPHLPVASRHG